MLVVQAEAAKELVADMQRKGLNPDIYTYAPLVGALGGAGRVEEAMQVCLRSSMYLPASAFDSRVLCWKHPLVVFFLIY